MMNIGVGLTSRCNCQCEHCYSRIYGNDAFLSTEKLLRFVDSYQIKSVNFGTGESYFHPDFLEILRYLRQKGIEVSLTTNGYTVEQLSDEEVKMLHDVDFSLDYPNRRLHDLSRKDGCFQMVTNGIQRCKTLGITCSIAWCLTPSNCSYIREMLELCKKLHVFLRVNIYKAIHKNHPGFSYELFWKSINELLFWGDIVSISEGVVNAAIGNGRGLQGCNCQNLRIFPDEKIGSCVYVPSNLMRLEEACSLSEGKLKTIFASQYAESSDSRCLDCPGLSLCRGGCMARRQISGVDRDEFCYMDSAQKPHFERIVYSVHESAMFVHSDYICTMILEPRGDIFEIA